MPKYSFVVRTNCTPGDEVEFNKWYDEVHIPDLLRIPGVVGAYRGHLASAQSDPEVLVRSKKGQEYEFLAIYKFDTDDVAGILAEIKKRSRTPEMMISDTLGEASPLLYQEY